MFLIGIQWPDTVRHFVEILPRLGAGVVVHLHDIKLPFEYCANCDGGGYSEQYMLATAFLFSDQWRVLAPIGYLESLGQLPMVGG